MNKKAISLILTGILTLSLSSAVFAAPPVLANNETTGRTEQERVTGVITPVEFEGSVNPKVTESITLTGTIVIDGPELKLMVTGNPNNNNNISIEKIADKTYAYSINASTTGWTEDVKLIINANTVYKNGNKVGQIHTSALPKEQTIKVEISEDSNEIVGSVNDVVSLWTSNGDNAQHKYNVTYTIDGKTYTDEKTTIFQKDKDIEAQVTSKILDYTKTLGERTFVIKYTLNYQTPTGSVNNK